MQGMLWSNRVSSCNKIIGRQVSTSFKDRSSIMIRSVDRNKGIKPTFLLDLDLILILESSTDNTIRS